MILHSYLVDPNVRHHAFTRIFAEPHHRWPKSRPIRGEAGGGSACCSAGIPLDVGHSSPNATRHYWELNIHQIMWCATLFDDLGMGARAVDADAETGSWC